MPIVCSDAFITLASDRFEAMVHFYQTLLSQPPQPYQSQRYAEFQLPGLKLAIFKPKPDHATEFAAPTSGSMSLCLELQDLAVAIATLTQLGYAPPGTIQTASHGEEIYAYDPAGNRLILHCSRG